jgi:hypothetical protein
MAGGGQGRRRGGGGGGAGAGQRAGQDEDPVTAAKRVLEQLNTRLAGSGDDKRGAQFAIRAIQTGFETLEKEVERLRHELERAHEAVRSVQGQGD